MNFSIIPKSYEMPKISFDTITMIILSIKSYKKFILKSNNYYYYYYNISLPISENRKK